MYARGIETSLVLLLFTCILYVTFRCADALVSDEMMVMWMITRDTVSNLAHHIPGLIIALGKHMHVMSMHGVMLCVCMIDVAR